MQRRILVVLLPSLEKAPAELASLGKISLSAIRNACSVGLGAQIEGDAADVLEALPRTPQASGRTCASWTNTRPLSRRALRWC
jgi:hypothetical protein